MVWPWENDSPWLSLGFPICDVDTVPTWASEVAVRLHEMMCIDKGDSLSPYARWGHSAHSSAGPGRSRAKAHRAGCKAPALAHTPFSTRPSQDKLSSQSFGTDLPLVDHQVEQHNIFHNEVKAIGPLLAKDGAKVGTVAEGTGDGGGHMCTAALTRALGSVPRNRTANSRPSTRNCW